MQVPAAYSAGATSAIKKTRIRKGMSGGNKVLLAEIFGISVLAFAAGALCQMRLVHALILGACMGGVWTALSAMMPKP